MEEETFVYGLIRLEDGSETDFRYPADVARDLECPGHRVTVEAWQPGYGRWRLYPARVVRSSTSYPQVEADIIAAAHAYAEEIAAFDLRELREQIDAAYEHAAACFDMFAHRRRIVDPDYALAVMEDVVEANLRRIWREREQQALLLAHGWDDAPDSERDVDALLAYADAWDADVAAMRAEVQEMEEAR